MKKSHWKKSGFAPVSSAGNVRFEGKADTMRTAGDVRLLVGERQQHFPPVSVAPLPAPSVLKTLTYEDRGFSRLEGYNVQP